MDKIAPPKNVDPVTIERIKTFHPKLREQAFEMYYDQCSRLSSPYVRLRYAYVIRTYKEQDALFAIGRTLNGKKVTNARGGQSYHNFGLAYDIVLLIDRDKNGTFEEASWDTKTDFDNDGVSDWMEVVAVAKMYGYTWGGDFKSLYDAPHFEQTFGFTVIQLAELVKLGRVYAGTSFPMI